MALLALFAFRHYGYEHWPQAQHGDIYGLSGALCLLALLVLTPLWLPIKAWMLAEEFLTAGCTAAYLACPQWFTYAFADERCSQAVGFRVSSIMLCMLAIVLWRLSTTQPSSSADEKEESK